MSQDSALSGPKLYEAQAAQLWSTKSMSFCIFELEGCCLWFSGSMVSGGYLYAAMSVTVGDMVAPDVGFSPVFPDLVTAKSGENRK